MTKLINTVKTFKSYVCNMLHRLRFVSLSHYTLSIDGAMVNIRVNCHFSREIAHKIFNCILSYTIFLLGVSIGA